MWSISLDAGTFANTFTSHIPVDMNFCEYANEAVVPKNAATNAFVADGIFKETVFCVALFGAFDNSFIRVPVLLFRFIYSNNPPEP